MLRGVRNGFFRYGASGSRNMPMDDLDEAPSRTMYTKMDLGRNISAPPWFLKSTLVIILARQCDALALVLMLSQSGGKPLGVCIAVTAWTGTVLAAGNR
jgi:hypothetical protein